MADSATADETIEFVGGPLDGDEFFKTPDVGRVPIWAIRLPQPADELMRYRDRLNEASSPDQTDPAAPARLDAVLELTPAFVPGGSVGQPPDTIGCYLVRGMWVGGSTGDIVAVLGWHPLVV
jgi:hypothetical protein